MSRTARRMRMAAAGRTALPEPLLTSSWVSGAVHTQHSLDSFGDATAVAAGKVLLRNATDVENQHIMGFGTISPEPTDGDRDYVESGLDGRLEDVMAGATTKVVTFALAPGWMREVPEGVTPIDDFSPQAWFHAPVALDKVADFAALCADIAATYTDVDYFIVWNEMKGHFLDAPDLRWDYERYTDLYNAVWTAVKAVRPDAFIGGPYINVGSNVGPGSPVQSPEWGWIDQRLLDVMTYWLANKTGADFVVVDGGNYPAGGATAGEFGKYRDLMAWLRALNNTTYPGAATLPVWIAEHYNYPPGASTDSNSGEAARYPAEWAVGTIEAIRHGYATCMLWGPQSFDGDTTIGLSYPLGLFNDTQLSGGGDVTTLHPVIKDFHDRYQAGQPIYIPDTGNANIRAIGNATHVTLINRAGTSQSTSGFTPSTTLTAYQVSTVTWTPVEASWDYPDPGTLWVDAFTSTANLAVKRGSVSVTSGRLRGGSTSNANMVTSPAAYDTPNHYAQVVVSTITNASSEVGVGLRFDTAGTRYYLGLIKASGAVELYYFNGASYTLLTSGSVTLGTLPGTLRGEVDSAGSNNLRLYWRGSLAIQTTHSTLTTGMPTTYEYPVGNVANVELDSWEADLL